MNEITQTHTYTHRYTDTHTHACTHTHTCKHTHVHTQTHTHTHQFCYSCTDYWGHPHPTHNDKSHFAWQRPQDQSNDSRCWDMGKPAAWARLLNHYRNSPRIHSAIQKWIKVAAYAVYTAFHHANMHRRVYCIVD